MATSTDLRTRSTSSDGGYVEFSDEPTDDGTSDVYTKYESTATSVLLLSGAFLVAWIIYIFWNIFKYSPAAVKILTEILLIIVIVIQLVILYKAFNTGIEVRKVEDNNQTQGIENNQIKEIMQKVKALTEFKINLRRFAYRQRDSPQETSVHFLLNSIMILSLLKPLKEAPFIIANLLSGSTSLELTAYLILSSAIGNILNTLYAKFMPCCNPCRGRCCWYDGCCCDPCCQCVTCYCLCTSHFPKHHRQYVQLTTQMLNANTLLNVTGALAKIYAVASIEDNMTQWHTFTVCLNFVSGALTVITLFKLNWRYYYVLCFYWSRMAVNKYESYKIHETLNGLLQEAYVFAVKVEKEDEFVRVDENVPITKKITLKWDCFTMCATMTALSTAVTYGYALFLYTHALNAGFDVAPSFDNNEGF